jgi:membrane protein
VSAALAAVSNYLKVVFPGAEFVLQIADIAISGALLTGMFAAIFKILPDTPIAWRDVAIGALVTAALFEGGKYLIALYIGTSSVASSYGAAGALIILLLWIFYSAQIFLLGAEFTRAFARRYGTHVAREVSSPTPS